MNIPPDMTHGAKFVTKSYGDLYIVKYRGARKVDIIFANTGRQRTVRAYELRRGANMPDVAPVALGDVYGRLTVAVARVAKDRHGAWSATCQCACGGAIEVHHSNLRSGGTVSCGCYSREVRTTHGLTNTLGYSSWRSMMNRCYRLDDIGYAAYGGAGITVCEDWHDVTLFMRDMGVRPKGMSIDRIDGTKGYAPGNCRWATASTQAYNRKPRSSHVAATATP